MSAVMDEEQIKRWTARRKSALGIGIHLFQAPILVLQIPELGHQRRIHAAELAAPLLECRRADAVYAA